MSFVLIAPEGVAATAGNLAGVGSTISAANAAAALPTTDVMAAAADRVSAQVALFFGGYGQQYQTISAQMAAFHQQFVQNLNTAVGSYMSAEAVNVERALLSTIHAPTEKLLSPALTGDANATTPGGAGEAGGLLYGSGGDGGLDGRGGAGVFGGARTAEISATADTGGTGGAVRGGGLGGITSSAGTGGAGSDCTSARALGSVGGLGGLGNGGGVGGDGGAGKARTTGVGSAGRLGGLAGVGGTGGDGGNSGIAGMSAIGGIGTLALAGAGGGGGAGGTNDTGLGTYGSGGAAGCACGIGGDGADGTGVSQQSFGDADRVRAGLADIARPPLSRNGAIPGSTARRRRSGAARARRTPPA